MMNLSPVRLQFVFSFAMNHMTKFPPPRCTLQLIHLALRPYSATSYYTVSLRRASWSKSMMNLGPVRLQFVFSFSMNHMTKLPPPRCTPQLIHLALRPYAMVVVMLGI
ncbi:hypothetical protein Bca4012_086720 [Brassica carinata]